MLYLTGSKILKLAIRKFKLSNFAFLILELFPEKVNKQNNKKLLDLEDFYLKTLLPNYNILTEAGNNFGYKHTELDRIQIKTSYSLERRLRIENLSPKTIEKKGHKALTNDSDLYSELTYSNLKNKAKSIILYNLDLTVFGEYLSVTEAAKTINCSVKTIYRALRSEKKLLKRRFIVKLKTN